MNSEPIRHIEGHSKASADAVSVDTPDDEHSPSIREHLRTLAAVSGAVSRPGFARLLGLLLVALLVASTGLASHDELPPTPHQQETVR